MKLEDVPHDRRPLYFTPEFVKACKQCGESKTLEHFTFTEAHGGRYYPIPRCRKCEGARFGEWSNRLPREKRLAIRKKHYREHTGAHIAKAMRHYMKRQYGLTPEMHAAMVAEQGGRCAICGQPPPRKRPLCVDHCHSTGTVRSLLCEHCNFAIGHMRENVEYLRSAIAYLEKWSTQGLESHVLAPRQDFSGNPTYASSARRSSILSQPGAK